MNTLIKLVLAPVAAYVALVAITGCNATTRLNEPATVITVEGSMARIDEPVTTIVVPVTEVTEVASSTPDYVERRPVDATTEPEPNTGSSAIALNAGE